jgi:Fe-S-cluster containining protein
MIAQLLTGDPGISMSGNQSESFYAHGLQFECLNCGNCCTGAPGYVYLSEGDIASIAEFLKKDKGTIMKQYTRRVHIFGEKRLSLTEKPNLDCVFWNKLCTIYEARPYQCRSFPFWKRHLVSSREWEKVGQRCPGVNRGPLYTAFQIEELVHGTPGYNIDLFYSQEN